MAAGALAKFFARAPARNIYYIYSVTSGKYINNSLFQKWTNIPLIPKSNSKISSSNCIYWQCIFIKCPPYSIVEENQENIAMWIAMKTWNKYNMIIVCSFLLWPFLVGRLITSRVSWSPLTSFSISTPFICKEHCSSSKTDKVSVF